MKSNLHRIDKTNMNLSSEIHTIKKKKVRIQIYQIHLKTFQNKQERIHKMSDKKNRWRKLNWKVYRVTRFLLVLNHWYLIFRIKAAVNFWNQSWNKWPYSSHPSISIWVQASQITSWSLMLEIRKYIRWLLQLLSIIDQIM